MIRPARTDELNFVRKAWIRTYASSEWALLCTPKDDEHTRLCPTCGRRSLRETRSADKTISHAGGVYWAGHHALIERLLARCDVSVFEARDGMLDGFSVREHNAPVLHYLYVKPLARGNGLAKELAGDATRISHLGKGQRPMSGTTYDPYAMMEAT